MNRYLGKVFLTAAIFLTTSVHATVILQSFDTDPGWTGSGNTSSGNNYGYSPLTSLAGGSAGEIGGTFSRTTPHSYVDTTLGGTFGNLSLDENLSISGRINVLNPSNYDNNIIFGFFNSSDPDNTALGLQISELTGSSFRLFNRLQSTHDSSSVPITGYDISRMFSATYDPSGDGKLIVVLDGPGGGTNTTTLTPSYRTSGVTFDSIGFLDGRLGDEQNNRVDIFIDDLAFTAPEIIPEPSVPEPATLLLMGLGLAGLGFARRRRLNA